MEKGLLFCLSMMILLLYSISVKAATTILTTTQIEHSISSFPYQPPQRMNPNQPRIRITARNTLLTCAFLCSAIFLYCCIKIICQLRQNVDVNYTSEFVPSDTIRDSIINNISEAQHKRVLAVILHGIPLKSSSDKSTKIADEGKQENATKYSINKERIIRMNSEVSGNGGSSLGASVARIKMVPRSLTDHEFINLQEDLYHHLLHREDPLYSQVGKEKPGASILCSRYDESIAGTCPICLDAYGTKDCWKSKHCTHYFHKKCILQWLVKKRSSYKCPCCRKNMITNNELIVATTQVIGEKQLQELVGLSKPLHRQENRRRTFSSESPIFIPEF